MALWNKISSTGNVEDRRGQRVGLVGGGLSFAGIAIVLLLNLLGGGNVNDTLNQLQNIQLQPTKSYDAKDFEGTDSYEVFTSKVLGSANEMWSKAFTESNLTYHEPK